MTEPSNEPCQSTGEELANSISHGLGLIGAIIVAPVLIITALRQGNTWMVVGASIFAASILLLYFSSTLYHALPHGRAKRVFQILDHSAIYLLIAGTYTPFIFGVLRGSLGWTLFGVVWGLALAGIVFKSVWGTKFPWISTALYLFMGWLIVVAIRPLWSGLSTAAMLWLVAGGLAYTVGVVFYATERIRYTHFIWHLFVLAGTACHCIAVLLI